MKKVLNLSMFLTVVFFLVSCSSDDDSVEVTDVHADLYGTWVSNRVAISGFGYLDGTSKVSFDSDGGYRSDISFTVSSTGCDYTLFLVGTFTGDETNVSSNMNRGEVEITGCTNPTENSTRDYTTAELEASGTSLNWEIVGNTLELIHTDGLNRIYVRQ
ncbi:hypothetical protein [uncultured Aquimarina sp.]|uniref:hypothetical protein n=1 Tax=uncultured Aquimarina sp. TaxID=575652 RepID=UPI002625A50A|nr:hypothetical protein [uncultured Aquimarina sp.]